MIFPIVLTNHSVQYLKLNHLPFLFLITTEFEMFASFDLKLLLVFTLSAL